MSATFDQVIALIEQLSDPEKVMVARHINVCPFDCDGCHDDDCICGRLGCAGYGKESEEP